MANWEQERAAIDAGRRGDKIPANDPSVVPLGADEEAAGVRTPIEAADARGSDPASDAPHGTSSGPNWLPLLAIGATAAITAAAIIAAAFGS